MRFRFCSVCPRHEPVYTSFNLAKEMDKVIQDIPAYINQNLLSKQVPWHIAADACRITPFS